MEEEKERTVFFKFITQPIVLIEEILTKWVIILKKINFKLLEIMVIDYLLRANINLFED